MRAILFIVLVSCLCLASATETQLPPGYNSANELATVLANEPDAARFASASFGADTITFKDDGAAGAGAAPSSRPRSSGDDETDADVSEFDAQIEQINNDLKKLKEAIKESEECARRLSEQQAEVRSLQEQRDHLEKEKEKRILQAKLEKQMRDLAEINRMSRSLRSKFSELKHTQKLIKTKMTGTRSTLSQLDADTEPLDTSALSEAADNISQEVDAMQKAQQDLLGRSHTRNTKQVKSTITSANKIYGRKGKEDIDV
jgi:DNA repair exonuclease SbcCD ATPase subunit